MYVIGLVLDYAASFKVHEGIIPNPATFASYITHASSYIPFYGDIILGHYRVIIVYKRQSRPRRKDSRETFGQWRTQERDPRRRQGLGGSQPRARRGVWSLTIPITFGGTRMPRSSRAGSSESRSYGSSGYGSSRYGSSGWGSARSSR